MKIKTFALFLLIILLSCSSKTPNFYETEVSLLRKTDYGIISLKSVGYGNGRNSATEDAQKKAFFALLYRGIPNSDYSYPLIENEVTFKNNFPNFNETFFKSGVYKSFIITNTESSNLINTSKGNKLFLDVTINYEALRRYLEQNSIIRKFGY
jgi:hypothetical protein